MIRFINIIYLKLYQIKQRFIWLPILAFVFFLIMEGFSKTGPTGAKELQGHIGPPVHKEISGRPIGSQINKIICSLATNQFLSVHE
jgi:hypothetical protein